MTTGRQIAALLATLFVISPEIWCYEVPLASRSVREGYFLGQRNGDKTEAFLEGYTRHFPKPQQGPYISEIRLFTPYARVVDVSSHKTIGYSAQQAQEEYLARGNSLLARVHIEFTPTYNDIMTVKLVADGQSHSSIAERPADFWKEFRYVLIQNSRVVPCRNISGDPQYTLNQTLLDGTFVAGVLVGADVYLDFDAESVASDEATLEVFAPGDQHIVAKFDLATLR